MIPDLELLRQYAEKGSEAAFAEVVRRHVDFVHSAALRIAAQDSQLAEDITQRVFTDLARKARFLSRHPSLAGWLHRCTRFTALAALRAERRRRVRELEASAMQEMNTTPDVSWAQLRPLLDEAVDRLGAHDREAVLLRFFHGKSHREVGEALGLSENSANKRIERALEKLRAYFSSRGVTTTSAILSAAISAHSVQAAPAGLVERVAPVSLAGVGSAGAGGAFLLSLIYMSTKTKTILAALIILAVVATLTFKLARPAEPAMAADPAATAPTVVATSPAARPPGTPATKPAAPAAKPNPAIPAATTPVAAAGSEVPANADLKTSIPALIHLLESDDFVGVIDFVLPPEALAGELKGHTREELGAMLRQELQAHGGTATLINALRMVEIREPTLDETGTHATYKLEVPFAGHNEIRFTKVDGRWYGPD